MKYSITTNLLDNVVLVSCVCLSVSSPVPDCQMHALDNVDTLVNKFHPASKWKYSGNFPLGSFFLAWIFLDDSELDVLCLARASCSVVLPVTELTLLLAICSINLWTRCQINSLSHCRSSAGKCRWDGNKANLPPTGPKVSYQWQFAEPKLFRWFYFALQRKFKTSNAKEMLLRV